MERIGLINESERYFTVRLQMSTVNAIDCWCCHEASYTSH